MAHMIRGSGSMGGVMKAEVPRGTGMVVGAVVNKPQHQTYGITVNPATASMPVSTGPHQHGVQLAPGLLSIKAELTQQNNSSSSPTQNTVAIGSTLTQQDMANTKEKTPMCLVNELARYNKIQHQYTLTDEQGPAHKKTFYVKLKLGETEEYSASGASIKKAQHSAAEIALKDTQLKKPPPKPVKNIANVALGGAHRLHFQGPQMLQASESITPTVELNALAMRRGEPAVYRPIDMPRAQAPQYYPGAQRYPNYGKYPRTFFVSLKVGAREFVGEGSTRQSARHHAAEKALRLLQTLPIPDLPESQAPAPVPEVQPQKAHAGVGPDSDNLKSEISLVHEIALKRSLTVTFEVIRESGPPHMRNFLTRCVCGDIVIEGEGNSKKLSKKRVAEKMLEKLQGLPPLPPSQIKLKKGPQNKKKNRNLVKIQKTAPEYGVGINPISRLIQIQQAKKEKEPLYSLLTERGVPRRREFVIQVEVGEQTATGVGPNKKLAKRNAADAMLQLLGYSRPSPQPTKPAIKQEGGATAGSAGTGGTGVTGHTTDKKVTFIDQETGHTRQLVPGVILMPQDARLQPASMGYSHPSPHHPHPPPHPSQQAAYHQYMQRGYGQQLVHPTATAVIAKELLDTGSSPTAESLHRPQAAGDAMSQVKPTHQLQYLADVLGFKIEYTDFPKGNNKTEYLSLVSLSTHPPQVSHGAGVTLDQSHDMAALTALRALSEMGLDTVKVKQEEMARGAGDGRQLRMKHGKK